MELTFCDWIKYIKIQRVLKITSPFMGDEKSNAFSGLIDAIYESKSKTIAKRNYKEVMKEKVANAKLRIK